MSTYDLIKTLINPQQETVMEAPAQPAAPAEPAGERVEVEDVDIEGKPKHVDSGSGYQVYEVPVYVAISYFHPSLDEPFQLGVNFKVRGNVRVEDDSFDYEYGSQRGVHGGKYVVFDDMSIESVEFPQEDYNYDLFKLPAERKTHVATFIKNYFESMKEDQIARFVDPEDVVEYIKDLDRRSYDGPDHD